jgi:hypothetical protein
MEGGGGGGRGLSKGGSAALSKGVCVQRPEPIVLDDFLPKKLRYRVDLPRVGHKVSPRCRFSII